MFARSNFAPQRATASEPAGTGGLPRRRRRRQSAATASARATPIGESARADCPARPARPPAGVNTMEAVLLAIVISGNARFTAMTPAMIRLEYSPTASFVDAPSMVFLNRAGVSPRVDTDRQDGWLIMRTDELELRYKEGSGPFTAENLSISFRMGSRQVTWRPGMADAGNLGGTRKSLDNISGAAPLGPGLLSRDGWVLLDESTTPLLPDGEGSWPAPRAEADAIDWVFLGYGHDYKRALGDFVQVAGRIPLPPKAAFGSWWSRYWPYSEPQVRDLVGEFREHEVPLDVLVLDMDWHLDGWSGYTWNPKYFPDPRAFLAWAHEQGLTVTLNLHPSFAVEKHEARYADFAKAIGRDPEKGEPIPFDHFDPVWVEAYFEHLIRPVEQDGVDFWWLDYGGHQPPTKLAGLDPLLWCNAMHFLDMQQTYPHKRPIMFSRWGGLANHRYQIGFSGDTHSTWESLAFQPYMTATAGNVAFPYWSHDVGGHYLGPVEGELYARWIQFAAFNPILRTHATVNPDAERRIWTFSPEVFEASRAAFHRRYELLPYIYTAARQCYDEGLPLCRPLYYEWPELPEAYEEKNAYLFGDDLLVAPITRPRGELSAYARQEFWLPPGTWCDWRTGAWETGPKRVKVSALLDDIPVFVRAGAIIPAQKKVRSTSEKPLDPLVLHVFAGPDEARGSVYEDDGRSPAYQQGQFARTRVTHIRSGADLAIEIGAAEGQFDSMLAQRGYEIRLHNSLWPQAVTVDGTPLERVDEAGWQGWRYEPHLSTVVITLDPRSTSQPTRVVVTEQEGARALVSDKRILGFWPIHDALLAAFGDAAPSALRDAANMRSSWGKDLDSSHHAWKAAAAFGPEEALAADVPAGVKERVARIVMGGDCDLAVSYTGEEDGVVAVKASLESFSPFAEFKGITGQISLTAPDGWVVQHPAKLAPVRRLLEQGQPLSLAMQLAPADRPVPGIITGNFTLTSGTSTLAQEILVPLLPGIDKWWVIGPFDNDTAWGLDHEFPPEKEIDLSATYDGDAGLRIGWRKAERRIQPGSDLTAEFAVNLHEFYGTEHSTCVAYALTYLHAPSDMDASLALGSDDGIRVWLNGEEVYRLLRWRPYASRQDRVPIRLQAGRNQLMFKIVQGGGGWGFGAHVETPDGKSLPEVRVALEP
jgi:alpha-glucosidase